MSTTDPKDTAPADDAVAVTLTSDEWQLVIRVITLVSFQADEAGQEAAALNGSMLAGKIAKQASPAAFDLVGHLIATGIVEQRHSAHLDLDAAREHLLGGGRA